MDPWTPEKREAWINNALNSDQMRGCSAPYNFRVYPKNTGSEPDDPKKSAMSDALARTLFEKNPSYRKIALKFYEMLVDKIRMSTFVNRHFMTNFFIVLKGGTAYRLLLGDAFAADFPFSDIDQVIYINPFLDPGLFDQLRESLNAILLQVMSQYKRILDHMLFLNKPTPEWFLDQATITQFKADLQAEFENITGFDGKFLSPCESDDIRNACSKYSFVLRNSKSKENSVTLVEVPHFEKCERIPLRRTPLMASHNSSISFNRDITAQQDMVGEFDLYRLKFTGLFVSYDDGSDDEDVTPSITESKISFDFIDVSIPHQTDADLLDFWTHGRCVNVHERITNMWLVLPDIHTCMHDLYKMLNVYECPEHKREKRQRRFDIFKGLVPS